MTDIFESGFLRGVETHCIASKLTGATHEIFISCPPSYSIEDRKYPLLIVLDANYCFGTAVETARLQASTEEAQEIIIVGVGTPGGIAEHGTRRLRDYTPGAGPMMAREGHPLVEVLAQRVRQKGLTFATGFGGSRQFAQFLRQELLPMLFGDLRIDADDIGLAGHSCGGAFAADLLLNGAHPFKKLIVGTFGVNWYEPDILAALEQSFASAPPGGKMFVGMGGAELADEGLAETGRETIAFLERLRHAAPQLDLTVRVFDDETHTSVLAIVLAVGIRLMWSSGMTYTNAQLVRRAREQQDAS